MAMAPPKALSEPRAPLAALPRPVQALLQQGLLIEPILVLGDPAAARALARMGLDARAAPARPALDRLGHAFATVLDLGWLAHAPEVKRRSALRDVAGTVAPGGVLHLLAAHTAASLRGLGRKQWTLLGAHEDGVPAGQWLLTFVHTAPPRRPPRRAVRHFTDLGAFGSLDFGASTESAYGG